MELCTSINVIGCVYDGYYYEQQFLVVGWGGMNPDLVSALAHLLKLGQNLTITELVTLLILVSEHALCTDGTSH